MRHLVERRASYKYLRRLPLKEPRAYSISEYRFDPKYLRLCKTPAVVDTFFLPLLAPHFPYPPHILIPNQPLTLAVAVLPNLSISSRRDCCLCFAFSYCLITIPLVIRAIATNLLNLILYLLKQVFKHLAVGKVVRSNHRSRYLAGRNVGPDMELSPSPSLGVAVLTDLPFTLAEDLYTRRVYDHMQRLSLFTTRQHHIESLATATQEAVIRHSQIQAHQLHNRLHKPLCRAQR